VLVVDDCHDTTDSLSMLLRLWGYLAHVAHDGPAALREAALHSPDVVLLDIGLPEMNGWDVARGLRKLPGTEKALLVAMSGYGSSADQLNSQNAGCDLHLLKPVAPDLLERILSDRSRRKRPCACEIPLGSGQGRDSQNGPGHFPREAFFGDKLLDLQQREFMSGPKVLIADPDESLLAQYQQFLANDRLRVETATSGLECLKKLRNFSPDVLVLEPELPWGRGEGVLACMHQDADLPRVPVVVLSHRLDNARLNSMNEFEVSAYYVKPLSAQDLRGCLRRLLNSQSVAANL
jgi:CheY-like chemotaxis protein